MRLPQSIAQSLSVRAVHFLTVSIAIALFAMVPMSVSAATPQLTCTASRLDFGVVVLSHVETLLVTLTNNGATSVTVSGMAASSSEFTTSSLILPLVLPAGQSVDLSVSFAPTARGWTYGTIEVFSNASNPALVLAVEGAGALSWFTTTNPSIVSFGQVMKGTSSTVPVVLTNARSSKLTISKLGTTGTGFSMNGPTLPLTLEGGQSVTVNVTFAPQAAGTEGGSLFAWGTGRVVPLTGTGIVTPYSVNLVWNSSSDVVGYNVYRSITPSGTYTRINSTLDSNTAYTDSTVVSGRTYYYAATSVSSSGQESTRSTPPVQAVIP
jgi:Abnormal spindle-like microcephaly-assoc'd, ASPM-SPD-2-Hydin